MVNIWKRYASKLRRAILLHFGLGTFRFHYRKDRKPVIFTMSGFLDVSMTPKANIIYLWRDQDALKDPRKFPNHFRKIVFRKFQHLGDRTLRQNKK